MYYENDYTYLIVQNVFLAIMGLHIFGVNLYTIGSTLYTQVHLQCPISKSLLSSHFANLLSGFFYYVNQIINSQNGTHRLGCSRNMEFLYFHYVGLIAAMATLLCNSFVSYHGICKDSFTVGGRKLTTKFFFLIWIVSAILAAGLMLYQKYFPDYMYLQVFIVLLLPFFFSIYFLIRILRYLSNVSRTSTLNRKESDDHIYRATTILKVMVGGYVTLLSLLMVCSAVAQRTENDHVQLVMIWMARLCFTFMCTLEAYIFLYKTPQACVKMVFTKPRQFIKKKWYFRKEYTGQNVVFSPGTEHISAIENL